MTVAVFDNAPQNCNNPAPPLNAGGHGCGLFLSWAAVGAMLRGMRGLPLLILLGACTSASAATVYKWVDDNGVTHFSDQPNPKAQKLEMAGAQTYGAAAPRCATAVRGCAAARRRAAGLRDRHSGRRAGVPRYDYP